MDEQKRITWQTKMLRQIVLFDNRVKTMDLAYALGIDRTRVFSIGHELLNRNLVTKELVHGHTKQDANNTYWSVIPRRVPTLIKIFKEAFGEEDVAFRRLSYL